MGHCERLTKNGFIDYDEAFEASKRDLQRSFTFSNEQDGVLDDYRVDVQEKASQKIGVDLLQRRSCLVNPSILYPFTHNVDRSVLVRVHVLAAVREDARVGALCGVF